MRTKKNFCPSSTSVGKEKVKRHLMTCVMQYLLIVDISQDSGTPKPGGRERL